MRKAPETRLSTVSHAPLRRHGKPANATAAMLDVAAWEIGAATATFSAHPGECRDPDERTPARESGSHRPAALDDLDPGIRRGERRM